MLAATLMRQQSRCLQGLGRQVLSPNSNKVPKNSLVPSQYLATTAINNHGSGDHVKMCYRLPIKQVSLPPFSAYNKSIFNTIPGFSVVVYKSFTTRGFPPRSARRQCFGNQSC